MTLPVFAPGQDPGPNFNEVVRRLGLSPFAGGGPSSTNASRKSSTPKFVTALPKNTGVASPRSTIPSTVTSTSSSGNSEKNA